MWYVITFLIIMFNIITNFNLIWKVIFYKFNFIYFLQISIFNILKIYSFNEGNLICSNKK